MLYYKIISSENKVIGAETGEGLRYVAYNGRNGLTVLTENKDNAYGIAYDGKIYPFEEATLSPVSVDEYNLIISAKQAAEEEGNDESLDFAVTDGAENADTTTLDYIRETKLKELSAACNAAIEYGVDVTLSDGETHHFSLTTQDQLNLLTLSSMATAGQTNIPYHADGELCKFYSAEDILTVVGAAMSLVTYHTSYYNSLKAYVQTLADAASVAAIEYGIEIPEEYRSEVLAVL